MDNVESGSDANETILIEDDLESEIGDDIERVGYGGYKEGEDHGIEILDVAEEVSRDELIEFDELDE